MANWVRNELLSPEDQAEQRSCNRIAMRRKRARQREREYPQPEMVEQPPEPPPAPEITDDMTELQKAHARVEATEEYRQIIARIRAEKAERERKRAEERTALHPFPAGRGVG